MQFRSALITISINLKVKVLSEKCLITAENERHYLYMLKLL